MADRTSLIPWASEERSYAKLDVLRAVEVKR